jgi:hypothetical protein
LNYFKWKRVAYIYSSFFSQENNVPEYFYRLAKDYGIDPIVEFGELALNDADYNWAETEEG